MHEISCEPPDAFSQEVRQGARNEEPPRTFSRTLNASPEKELGFHLILVFCFTHENCTTRLQYWHSGFGGRP